MKNNKRLIDLVTEIRSFCAAHADERTAQRYARYFREGYDPYGVPDKDMHPQRERWFAENRDLGLAGFLDLGDLLTQDGKYEEASLACFFAARFRDRFKPATFQRIGRWFDAGVRNWAHTDYISGELLGCSLAKGVVGLEAMDRWRRAKSRWKRRAVPVSMLALLKQGKDCRPLLEFVDPMMLDSERVVHQGLGWFLREAWKRQPKPVERFLRRWKDSAARLIFQYATEKMTAAQKRRFRAEK
jgi:3-methyladenine DNA glycosylase AlkD